jgi:hypothetical protein
LTGGRAAEPSSLRKGQAPAHFGDFFPDPTAPLSVTSYVTQFAFLTSTPGHDSMAPGHPFSAWKLPRPVLPRFGLEKSQSSCLVHLPSRAEGIEPQGEGIPCELVRCSLALQNRRRAIGRAAGFFANQYRGVGLRLPRMHSVRRNSVAAFASAGCWCQLVLRCSPCTATEAPLQPCRISRIGSLNGSRNSLVSYPG